MTRRRLYLIRTPKPEDRLPPDFAAMRASQIAKARAERRRLTLGPFDQERAA